MYTMNKVQLMAGCQKASFNYVDGSVYADFGIGLEKITDSLKLDIEPTKMEAAMGKGDDYTLALLSQSDNKAIIYRSECASVLSLDNVNDIMVVTNNSGIIITNEDNITSVRDILPFGIDRLDIDISNNPDDIHMDSLVDAWDITTMAITDNDTLYVRSDDVRFRGFKYPDTMGDVLSICVLSEDIIYISTVEGVYFWDRYKPEFTMITPIPMDHMCVSVPLGRVTMISGPTIYNPIVPHLTGMLGKSFPRTFTINSIQPTPSGIRVLTKDETILTLLYVDEDE